MKKSIKATIILSFMAMTTLSITACSSGSSEEVSEETTTQEEVAEDSAEETTSEGKVDEETTTEDNSDDEVLTIATTTSLYSTGLLDELETDFESKYDYDVEYIVVGSGAAMEMARNGEVDGVFVHSKEAEEQLIEDGVSLGRNPIMYDYFEIVGPETLDATDLEGVLDEIRENKTFVSRGDDSGTNVKELDMWGDNLPKDYVETGKGMSDTLVVASEMQAYTLTDDGTFLVNEDDLDLVEVYKNDEFFKNEYSFHCVNPELNEYINADGAEAYLEYLQSDETLDLIANYGVEEYGKPFYTLID